MGSYYTVSKADTIEFIFAIILYPLTLFLVINRLYVRIFAPWGFSCLTTLKAWTPSDIFVIFAWLTTLPRAVQVFYMYYSDVQLASKGESYQQHYNDVDGLILLRLRWVLDVTYFCPMYFVKASLLFLYSEILSSSRVAALAVRMRWTIRGTGVLVFIGAVSAFFTVLFACNPVSVHWNFTEKTFSDECAPLNKLWAYLLVEILHMGTDLIVFLLPFFFLRLLSEGVVLTTGQKFSAVAMFSLGFVSIASSALMAYILWFNRTVEGGIWGTWDGQVHWQRYLNIYTRKAEQATAIMVVCMPALRKTVRDVWRHIKGRKAQTTSDSEMGKEQTSIGGSSMEERGGSSAGNGKVRHYGETKVVDNNSTTAYRDQKSMVPAAGIV